MASKRVQHDDMVKFDESYKVGPIWPLLILKWHKFSLRLLGLSAVVILISIVSDSSVNFDDISVKICVMRFVNTHNGETAKIFIYWGISCCERFWSIESTLSLPLTVGESCPSLLTSIHRCFKIIICILGKYVICKWKII